MSVSHPAGFCTERTRQIQCARRSWDRERHA